MKSEPQPVVLDAASRAFMERTAVAMESIAASLATLAAADRVIDLTRETVAPH